MIQIRGQYGDPKAPDFFFPLQKKLNDLFKKYLKGVYFDTLIKLSIIFRVSGKVRDFDHVGPEKLKYLKKDNELTIDLAFSEEQWKNVDKEQFRKLVKEGVNECITLLLEKAESLNEVEDINTFKNNLEQAFSKF